MLLKQSLAFFLLLLVGCPVFAAVILQYHHVGDNTPRSTSVSREELITHMNWLKNHGFKIIPLTDLVKRIQNKSLNEQDKIASVSFDDLGASFCANAWPVLKSLNIPFTLFVNTSTIKEFASKNGESCSWQDIKTMDASGLLTIGNHTHTHLHMLEHLDENEKEIMHTQKIIDGELGVQAKLFAYPYGEFNEVVEKQVEKLGFVGFGQQSGAIGNDSDLRALPRFPASGKHANMKTLADKLMSLPFPISKVFASENPSRGKIPELTLYLSEDFSSKVQCYLGDGSKIETIQSGNKVIAKSQHALQEGRVRYNCTAPSKYEGRFYWYSQQWLYRPF